jgi:hypothetical protein
MWFIMDGMLAIMTLLAHKPIWLPISYVIGAGSMTITLAIKARWVWTRREILSAIAAAISAFVWQTHGAEIGVVAGVAALTAAGIPVFMDMVDKPVRDTFPAWAITTVGCIFTLIASDWTFVGTIVAWGGIAYNGSLALVVLRDK